MAEKLQQNQNQIESQEQLEPQSSSNKRIAKNTIMLYIRMFLAMIVGFYTSRVVLNTLGVEDYGIYGVVGGVVAMFGFINASMSGATSRFLTFELGRLSKDKSENDSDKSNNQLKDTFSSALIIHIGIAIIILIVSETVGLWFLCNKLVIPEERMAAAQWVYQFSIISALMGITQVPYNASIIAHEKMDVYAYIEILHVILKLLILYLLSIGDFDKLILYAALVLAVSILIMMIYRVYCIRHYAETHFRWVWNINILKPMLKFSGWNVYGNLCVTIRQQGTNFLINIFYGVIFNAASTVATMLQGVVKGFTYSSTMAFRPQIIKNYACGNINQMCKLIYNSLALASSLMGVISIPVFMEIDYFMELWLVNVPIMATTFVRILLFSAFFALITIIFTISIEATGKNKYMNLFSGTIYMLTIPVMYCLFKLGFGVDYSYYSILGANMLIFISNLLISKYLIPEINLSVVLWTLAKTFLCFILSSIPLFFIKNHFEPSLLRMITNSILGASLTAIFSFFIILNKETRKLAIKMIMKKINLRAK